MGHVCFTDKAVDMRNTGLYRKLEPDSKIKIYILSLAWKVFINKSPYARTV